MPSTSATVLVLAGEPSGDVHAAAVVRAIRARVPDAHVVGIGGPRLEAQGVALIERLDRLAVMGIVEVLPKLAFFQRLERRVRALIRRRAVDLVLAVDYPGFNLRAIRGARARGVPVLYYIAPKVWAWRPGRVRQLAADTDRVAVILPFEEELLRRAGIDARFVGHPLVDQEAPVEDRQAFARRVGIDPERPWLALLPGSRRGEVRRHLGPFVAAARRVTEARADVQPVIARAAGIPPERFVDAGLPVTDEGRALLRHSTAALIKSGTGTLEAALEGVPMVAAYRVNPVTYRLARRLVKIPYITLPNLILREPVVRELLQDDVTPERLAEAVLPLLDVGSPERARMRAALARVGQALGRGGAAERVADMALDLLGARAHAESAGSPPAVPPPAATPPVTPANPHG